LKNPKKTNVKTSHIKGTAKSRIWGAETPKPIVAKFCMPGAVLDVITPANFYQDWLRGFGVARVEFWPFPCFVAFKTLSHYRASV